MQKHYEYKAQTHYVPRSPTIADQPFSIANNTSCPRTSSEKPYQSGRNYLVYFRKCLIITDKAINYDDKQKILVFLINGSSTTIYHDFNQLHPLILIIESMNYEIMMTVFFFFSFQPFPSVRGGHSVSSFSTSFCLQHPEIMMTVITLN